MSPPWRPRPLIAQALQEFQTSYDKNNAAVAFLQLPTGYGKSTITLSLISHIISKGNLGRSVIHVLPLRSIITDLSKRLHGWFPKVGLPKCEIAAQHMGSAGSPFFAKRMVITTLDTFSLNFFKLPAIESAKAFRTGNAHFEFPRGLIYSSMVVFDETHLFALDSGSYRQIFTILAALLTQLASSGVPIFVITATLPTKIREYLRKRMIADNTAISKIYRKGDDLLFEEKEGRRNIITSILTGDDQALKIIAQEKGKILVILNEVSRAITFYKALRHSNPILLHGRMTESERKANVEKLYRSNSWLAIGTQVIEAGIDVNANVLVTDLAPIDRLVQRAGRVARSGGGSEGKVCIIENYSKVYQESDMKATLQILNNQIPNVDWVFEAQELVDRVYSNLEVPSMIDNYLLRFLEEMDQNLLYGVADMKDLINAIGSFPREASLVKAYAPTSFSNNTLIDKDGFFGLDSSVALKALRKSKKVVARNRIEDIDYRLEAISPDNLPRILEEREYDGILLDSYEKGVGYV